MTTNNEPEQALIGCTAVAAGPPKVPSVTMHCVKCGARVWVSNRLLEDLALRGVAPGNIHPLCLYTCMVIAEGTLFNVTEGQRENLRAKGLTDDQIEATLQLAFDLVQREGG